MAAIEDGKPDRPARLLVPVPSLGVPEPWRVGRVIFHPGSDAGALIESTPPFRLRDGSTVADLVDEVLGSAAEGCIAELDDVLVVDEAINTIRTALDALRLLQMSSSITKVTSFGLPGELFQSHVDYVVTRDYAFPSWRRRGEYLGWRFDAAAIQRWSSEPAFRFLDQALVDPRASDAARRAVLGTQLYSRAAVEHRLDVKMLGLIAALESWLVDRHAGGVQTLRLAQHVSWFACGDADGECCGRGRPTCPYLRLDPDSKHDRRRLSALRELGNTSALWRCSEWHRIMDWYDSRSGAAHGDIEGVDPEHPDRADFAIARYLALPILEWLASHRESPVGDLKRAMRALPEPARWKEMLSTLDAPDPQSVPPYPS
jgi:hypothetical protein